MKSQTNKFPYFLLFIAGNAAFLFTGAGTARIRCWGPAASGGVGNFLPPGEPSAIKARLQNAV